MMKLTSVPLSAGIVAIALFWVTVAVNLEVPLYKAYAQAADFGDGQTAIVFAAYVVGLLTVLLIFGGISDRIGCKAAILSGLLIATLATGLMIVSPIIQTLLLVRILQGIGVGLSLGSGTVWLAELLQNPSVAASLTGITTTLGLGSGALITSAALFFHKSMVPISYWGVCVGTIAWIALVYALPNQQSNPADAFVKLPYFPSGTTIHRLAILSAWSITGVIIAILPTELAHHQLTNWTGLMVFLSIAAGTLVQPLARCWHPIRSLRLGCYLLTVACILLVSGITFANVILILTGSAIAGMSCFGFTYLGGLEAVAQTGKQYRARTVSGYFLFAYVGLGLPPILLGFLADQIGALRVLVGFGLAQIAINAFLELQLKQKIRNDTCRVRR